MFVEKVTRCWANVREGDGKLKRRAADFILFKAHIDDVVDCTVGNVDLIEEYTIHVCADVIAVRWLRTVRPCSGEPVEATHTAILRLPVESRIGDAIDTETVRRSSAALDGSNGDFHHVDNRHCQICVVRGAKLVIPNVENVPRNALFHQHGLKFIQSQQSVAGIDVVPTKDAFLCLVNFAIIAQHVVELIVTQQYVPDQFFKPRILIRARLAGGVESERQVQIATLDNFERVLTNGFRTWNDAIDRNKVTVISYGVRSNRVRPIQLCERERLREKIIPFATR